MVSYRIAVGFLQRVYRIPVGFLQAFIRFLEFPMIPIGSLWGVYRIPVVSSVSYKISVGSL